MIRWQPFAAALLALAAAAAPTFAPRAFAADKPEADQSAPQNAAFVEKLQAALKAENLPEDDAGRKKELLARAEGFLGETRENVAAQETLKRAIDAARSGDDRRAIDELQAAIREVIVLYSFQPILEAKTPEGFPRPKPGTLGVIEVRDYPAYRMARTAMKAEDERAFWTLFQHIEKNKIAMTAPVEMKRRNADAKDESMAFLYESARIGEPGKKGDVEVVDVPAMTVVSIGDRGDVEGKNVQRATDRLEKWLADRKDEYKPVGEPRLMGYNSPMVPAALRYFEVQIPVEKLQR